MRCSTSCLTWFTATCLTCHLMMERSSGFALSWIFITVLWEKENQIFILILPNVPTKHHRSSPSFFFFCIHPLTQNLLTVLLPPFKVSFPCFEFILTWTWLWMCVCLTPCLSVFAVGIHTCVMPLSALCYVELCSILRLCSRVVKFVARVTIGNLTPQYGVCGPTAEINHLKAHASIFTFLLVTNNIKCTILINYWGQGMLQHHYSDRLFFVFVFFLLFSNTYPNCPSVFSSWSNFDLLSLQLKSSGKDFNVNGHHE